MIVGSDKFELVEKLNSTCCFEIVVLYVPNCIKKGFVEKIFKYLFCAVVFTEKLLSCS